MRLTQARIDGLKCPAGGKDMLVFDDEQRGLGVRVTAGGGKSFIAQYTLHRKKRRIPLGSCSAISLAKAREAARAIMGEVAKGLDPAMERKQARLEAHKKAAHEALTLVRLLEDWQALHLTGKRPKYAIEAVRALRNAFARYLDLPAADLDRAAVVRALDALTKKGHAAMAARTAAYGKAAFGWAVKRGALASNPFTNLPIAPTVKRERVLSDEELAAIWRATEREGPFNSIVRLLVLTGQRREEVNGLRWDELSSDLAIWTIPGARTKNGVAHVVPLSALRRNCCAPAVGWRIGLPRTSRLFQWVLKAKAALDAASGVSNWRLHDLRRTMATGLQRLGVRLEVTEAALNHTSGSRGGIVGVYQRHDFAAEKQAALAAWAAHVMALVEGREPESKVVALAARASQ